MQRLERVFGIDITRSVHGGGAVSIPACILGVDFLDIPIEHVAGRVPIRANLWLIMLAVGTVRKFEHVFAP